MIHSAGPKLRWGSQAMASYRKSSLQIGFLGEAVGIQRAGLLRELSEKYVWGEDKGHMQSLPGFQTGKLRMFLQDQK